MNRRQAMTMDKDVQRRMLKLGEDLADIAERIREGFLISVAEGTEALRNFSKAVAEANKPPTPAQLEHLRRLFADPKPKGKP